PSCKSRATTGVWRARLSTRWPSAGDPSGRRPRGFQSPPAAMRLILNRRFFARWLLVAIALVGFLFWQRCVALLAVRFRFRRQRLMLTHFLAGFRRHLLIAVVRRRRFSHGSPREMSDMPSLMHAICHRTLCVPGRGPN